MKEYALADITLVLKANGPVFLHGAEPRGATEWRAPSVRGQLRYWLRAIEGARLGGNVPAVWQAESAVFGSTGRGSAVAVRCREGDGVQHGKEKPVPHSKTFTDSAILEGSSLKLFLSTRPGVPLPPQALNTLTTWLLLGGIGKRSRRLFGSLQVTGSKSETVPDDQLWWKQDTSSADKLIDAAKSHFRLVMGDATAYRPIPVPSFPLLHPQQCWVLVGRERFASAEEANRVLFTELLRKPPFLDDSVFGYVRGSNRRASPLIAHAHRVAGDIVPILTAFRSENNESLNWNRMNQFMTAAQKRFNAETVWGGELK